VGRERIVLVVHTTSYAVEAFIAAARRVGVGVVLASDRCPILDRAWDWPEDSWVIDFYDPDGAAGVIAAGAAAEPDAPVRAVLPVGGEGPARVAALAARRIGLDGRDPDAVATVGNKLRLRELCATVGASQLAVPRFIAAGIEEPPAEVAERVAAAVGWPCVLKPLLLSASRGVMRADDAQTFVERFARLRRMLLAPALLEMDPIASRQILVEEYVDGPEVALEGLLYGDTLHPLAIFDKPDPLEGPFFEETIYVTPSRSSAETQSAIASAVAAVARAVGIGSGPVHAELRLGGRGAKVGGPPQPVVIDLAARPIGGLCSRALRFVRDVPLEELVIRQALGQDVRALVRAEEASGVMMIPIPRGGILRGVNGVDEARAVPGIEDVVISIRAGETVVPLPEGASYLGFIFARGESPAAVEEALRRAHARLDFDIAARLPVETTAAPRA
jgi:biotin carboxylase